MRRTLAASTVGAIFIASRVAVVVAIVIGSNIYDCMLCFVDRVELDAAVSSSRRRMAADAAQQRGGLRQAAQAADTGGRAASRAACFAVQCRFMSVSPMRARECTKMLFLGAVDACVCVACAHLLFPTLAHTWVCVVCACGTVEKSPLDPLMPLSAPAVKTRCSKLHVVHKRIVLLMECAPIHHRRTVEVDWM